MNFTESLITVLLKKYFTFSGRASRSEFWWFVLFRSAIYYLLYRLQTHFMSEYDAQEYLQNIWGWELVFIIIEVYLLIASASVTVRRLHDCNFSGWWTLIIVAVYISSYQYIVFEFIPVSSEVLDSIDKVFIGILLLDVILHVVLVKKGSSGSNKFGPDPLAPKVHVDVFL